MKFEGGRGKPEAELELEDSLEKKMMKLAEMRTELRGKQNEYKANTKHLRESIKSLENIITAEVIANRKSVTVGNIRAEYVPTVRIQMMKEK